MGEAAVIMHERRVTSSARHSSLSALGLVVGGPVSVIHALLAVVGPDGTKGRVGSAQARLFRQRNAVDFAVEWLHARGF